MKYLVALCALFVACGATTGPQDAPFYVGHYVAHQVNGVPVELLDIHAEWWLYEDMTCYTEVTREGEPTLQGDCEYTEPEGKLGTSNLWLAWRGETPSVAYYSMYLREGWLVLNAGPYTWEFEKVGR